MVGMIDDVPQLQDAGVGAPNRNTDICKPEMKQLANLVTSGMRA